MSTSMRSEIDYIQTHFQDDPLAQARVARSHSAYSFLAWQGEKMTLTDLASDGASIIYGECGKSRVTLGEPLGNHADSSQIIREFISRCEVNNMLPVLANVGSRVAEVGESLGLVKVKIGEEAVLDLMDYMDRPRSRMRAKRKENELRKKGVRLELVYPPCNDVLFAQVQQISEEWLAKRRIGEMGFVLGKFDKSYLMKTNLIVAFDSTEKPVAFTNLLVNNSKEEAALDLFRRSNSSPYGMPDSMIFHALKVVSEMGVKRFNLGLAPLSNLKDSNSILSQVGVVLFNNGERLYPFKGVRTFKEKYSPEWVPKYILTKPGFSQIISLYDTALLVSGGWRQLLKL